MIAVGKYISPDGSCAVTTGLLPDIEVKSDYNAFLEGRDNVLEQAIEELRKLMN
jgi:C-terminal processing protease CtpA/Prc